MKRLVPVGLLALTLAGVAAAMFIPFPAGLISPRVTTMFDFGHFWLFALVTWLLWWALRRRLLLAVSVAALIATVCEAGQLWSSRSANLPDFLRNLLGVSAAAAVRGSAEFDPHPPRTPGDSRLRGGHPESAESPENCAPPGEKTSPFRAHQILSLSFSATYRHHISSFSIRSSSSLI